MKIVYLLKKKVQPKVRITFISCSIKNRGIQIILLLEQNIVSASLEIGGVCRIPNFQLSLGETMLLYQMNPTRLMAISILNSTFGQIWIYLHFSSMIIHLIDH